jgi:predicted Zn finger-like uncharacterized protein
MPIVVECPSCNRKLRVPDDLLGRLVKCPTCSSTFTAAESAGGGGAPVEEPPPAPREEIEEERPGRVSARRQAPAPEPDYDDRGEDEDYDERRPRRRRRVSGRNRSEALASVNGPAVALMIYGILGCVCGLCDVVYCVAQIGGGAAMVGGGGGGNAGPFQNDAAANMFGGGVGLVRSIIALAVSGLIILSAVKMQKLQGYGLAMTGSILAMIPCISWCCLLGLPFGIWALVILNQDHVKRSFE